MMATAIDRPSQESPTNTKSRPQGSAFAWSINVAILALLGSVACAPAVRAQSGDFSLNIAFRSAFTQIIKPVGPEENLRLLNLATLVAFAGPFGDPFANAGITLEGKWDPYIAARIEVTNLTDSPQPLGMSMLMPMQPVPTPTPYITPFPTFTGLFTAELKDTNGDGSASYTGGGAGFALNDGVIGTRLTSNHAFELTEPGIMGVYDVGPSPIPQNFRSGQWNVMEFLHFAISPVQSSLSAGDSVEFYAFGCVALPGTSCPTPPELSLPVPEPHEYALMLAGLAVIAAAVRRTRRGNS